MDWKLKLLLAVIGGLVIALLAYLVVEYSVMAAVWLYHYSTATTLRIATIATILTLAVWSFQLIPATLFNLWSYVFGFCFCVMLNMFLHPYLAAFLGGAEWTSTLAWYVTGLFSFLVFVKGCLNEPIPVEYGTCTKFMGARFPTEVREGYSWSPFGVFKRRPDADDTDKTPYVRVVEEPFLDPYNIEAIAPDGMKVTAEISGKASIFSVYRWAKHRGQREALSFAMTTYTKTRIEREYHGDDAVSTALNRDAIDGHVEGQLQEKEGNAMGMHVKTQILRMLPPEAVMASAMEPEIQRNRSEALKIAAKRLAKRAKKFARRTGSSFEAAMDWMQAEDGKATRSSFKVEGISDLVKAATEILKQWQTNNPKPNQNGGT